MGVLKHSTYIAFEQTDRLFFEGQKKKRKGKAEIILQLQLALKAQKRYKKT